MANLTKVIVVHNSQYQRSGPKSYVSLLRKYKFAPTKEGPYFVGNKVHTRGTAFRFINPCLNNKHGSVDVVSGFVPLDFV